MDTAAVASEMKFVVDEETAAAIGEWARAELLPDPHAADPGGDGYETTSLYFDTPAFDLFFRRGSTARAKFRIRRYNGGPVVFLERKMRTSGRVIKRRSEIVEGELARLTEETPWAGRWFARRLRLRCLQPVCQISYKRIARLRDLPSGRVRLTLDRSLTVIPAGSIAFSRNGGLEIVPGQSILELKFPADTPSLFTELIRTFGLEPRSMSKYRMAIRTLGLANDSAASAPR